MGCACSTQENTQTNQNVNSNYNSSSRPVVPEDWSALFKRISGGMNGQGFNSIQQLGADKLTGMLNDNTVDRAGNVANSAYGNAQNIFNSSLAGLQAYANNDNPNLLGRLFSTPTASAPSAAAPGDVQAKTGASFMSQYQNPFENDVVNSTLAQYDNQAAKGFNALRASQGNAFANKRTGLAQGEYLANSDMNRAALASSLRSQGFNTAAGLGQQDASRDLSAGQTNAGNTLDLNKFNSLLSADLSKYNSGMEDSRQKSDISSLDNFDTRNIGINQFLNSNGVGTQANLGSTSFNTTLAGLQQLLGQNQAAGSYGQMGTDQLLKLLGIGTSTFGTDSSGNSNSTTTGTGSGSKTDVMGSLGKAGQAALIFSMLCWVAREVYSPINPKWMRAREWMTTKAPKWLLNLYAKHGERFAEWISDKPKAKRVVKFAFDQVIAHV